ncbi:MAG: ribonuclease H-like domain-containing protein [Methanomicrobiales archaeon]|mgnify:CR=1 FL=1|nr:ribonuclease H-like domain-containing protein [Methanomicrobiales archaeon]MDI6876817.1 ribonuclease H-like domain-containing protein [Methanomicrobiales archaeon]
MRSFPSPDRISRRWQERIEALQEYAVVRDGSVFRTSLSDSFLYESSYNAARRLRDDLIREWAGGSLEDALPGDEVENGAGRCYHLQTRDTAPLSLPGRGDPRRRLLSDLTLIHGIGPVTARRLQGRGYRTIEDLLRHPRFRGDARAFLQRLDGGDVRGLVQWMARRRTHPRMLDTSRLLDPEEMVFLDLETLGLFSRPIILIGMGALEGERLTVHQYLIRDVAEEPAALAAALAHLNGGARALVTFNGKTFDLPYLQERAAYYGIPMDACGPHFDMLHFSRRQWKGRLPDCRLATLERNLFNHQRGDDVPSQMVPEFYDAYRRTGSPGPLIPIVEHNRQDVVTLARLYARLLEAMHDD